MKRDLLRDLDTLIPNKPWITGISLTELQKPLREKKLILISMDKTYGIQFRKESLPSSEIQFSIGTIHPACVKLFVNRFRNQDISQIKEFFELS